MSTFSRQDCKFKKNIKVIFLYFLVPIAHDSSVYISENQSMSTCPLPFIFVMPKPKEIPY